MKIIIFFSGWVVTTTNAANIELPFMPGWQETLYSNTAEKATLLTMAAPNWIGGITASNSNSWNTPANWSTNAVPGVNDIITVTGAGSFVDTQTVINLGNGGTGYLGITAGATFNWSGTIGDMIYLGSSTGSSGNLLIDGANSIFNGSGIQVAAGTHNNSGTGNLAIQNGGLLNADNLNIGSFSGGTGNVLISDNNSKVIVNPSGGFVYVGNAGTGNLTIANQGQLLSKSGRIGGFLNNGYNASGTVIIENSASWTNSFDFGVGGYAGGTGTFIIRTGGTFTNADIGVFGLLAGSTGQGTVDNATWNNGKDMYVGYFGSGQLTITGGGIVNNTIGRIGDLTGGNGTVTVSGTNSTWTNSDILYVGNSGTGMLTVSNGGKISSSKGYVGNSSGSTGQGTIDNAVWNNGSDMYVGYQGSGQLTISGGGNVNNTLGHIGDQTGSSGAVTVAGANSKWTNSGTLYVGNYGTGALNINVGGSVSSNVSNIGNNAGSTGTVTVSNGGQWTDTGFQTVIGQNGTGTLNIQNGGLVNSMSTAIGLNSGGTGTVLVDGSGSIWTSNNQVGLGGSGVGTLTITNGGRVNTDVGWIKFNNIDSSQVMVSGTNSALNTALGVEIDSGVLTIENNGIVIAPLMYIGYLANYTGTVNINSLGQLTTGGIIGGAGTKTFNVDGGIIKASQDNSTFIDGFNWNEFIIQAGGLTIDSNGYNIEITPPASFTGTGGLTKEGAGTLILNGAHNYAGTTLVKAGTLLLNGMIASGVEVQGGTFKLGSDQPPEMGLRGVQAFATSGRNSAIAGDFVQQENSVYEVAVNGQGQADLMRVGGTAALNRAKVRVAKINEVTSDAVYPILYAEGGIAGTYSGLTDDSINFPFLDFNFDYDKQHVYLHLKRNAASFAELGITANQQALAHGAKGVAADSLLYQAVVVLPTIQAVQGAFDSLSGEIHASMTGILLDQSHYLADAVLNRLNDEMGQNNYWLQGFGNWGSSKSNGNAASLTRQAGGLLAGADSDNTEDLRLGVAGGYSHMSVDVKARLSQAQSASYHLGLYGSRQIQQLRLIAGGAYSWHAIASHRAIQFSGLNEQIKADYHANGLQGYAETGYRLINNRRGQLEPFIQAAYVRLNSTHFFEQAEVTGLVSERTTQDLTYSTLGTRLASKLNQTAGMNWQGRALLGWRHAYSGITPAATFRFASGEGSSFAITGVPLAPDALMVDAGIIGTSAVKPWQVTLAYNGQLASHVKDNGVRGVVSWQFN